MLLLITGASGAGKSTVRAALKADLSSDVQCVELAELAPMPARVSLTWRQQTAELAVRRAVELQPSHQHLLLAGDPVAAIEIVAAPSATQLDGLAVCLLGVSPEAQAARLTARGDDPALLSHHQAFAAWMRRQATDPLHMPHVVSDQGWEAMCWERLERMTDQWCIRRCERRALRVARFARPGQSRWRSPSRAPSSQHREHTDEHRTRHHAAHVLPASSHARARPTRPATDAQPRLVRSAKVACGSDDRPY